MHDIKAIRDNPEAFDAGLKRRGMAPLAADILSLDQERRRLVQVAEEMQAQRNSISREIGKLKAAGDETAATAASAEVSRLKEAMPAAEAAEREVAAAIESLPTFLTCRPPTCPMAPMRAPISKSAVTARRRA
jgi:seryl-tRNA synthetase